MAILRTVLLTISLAGLGLISVVDRALAQEHLYDLRISDLRLKAEDRIVSVIIEITSGSVVEVTGIPVGWNFVIDNDPSWTTNVAGRVVVGAAALSQDGISKLGFKVRKVEFNGLKFTCSAEVDTTEDFRSVKKITLPIQKLILSVSQ